jgi:hypothetical protein
MKPLLKQNGAGAWTLNFNMALAALGQTDDGCAAYTLSSHR